MKKILMTLFLGSVLCTAASRCQGPRIKKILPAPGALPLRNTTIERLYVGDLDKDSYVKFENTYILDRNDFGKPLLYHGGRWTEKKDRSV